ncbi:MarR family transcriptional regulator [Streptomyces sp. 840.1]|uniref:MarR family winged helix-turn-helix transcriptional regulator n=1 Tax=Streptomyces sp. 840.1 TaxID=2485152 RepID=UPI000F92E5C0|nr:MarR family transcriptional regulator [Streptomyces sp. 840.1]ROQ60250.1 MarR family transcriptional regulator [Streptomyces sp. 840.1]
MVEGSALSAQEERAWRELGRLVHCLPRLLEEDMQRVGLVTPTEFSVLSILGEAEGHRLRMAEIAARAGLTASRITRLVAALGARSLVAKERDGADGRGTVAVLTRQGLAELDQARPHHFGSARRHFLDHVPESSLPGLTDALTAVTDALIPQRACPADPVRE